MKYRVIYADPPWQYHDKTLRFGEARRAGKSGVDAHYDSMPLEHIKLVVPYMTEEFADDCYLFLWATNPMLQEAFEVMKAWEFKL